MKNPYDENGLPRNIEVQKVSDDCAIVYFSDMPKSKYFDDETWVFYLREHCNSAQVGCAPKVDTCSKANFSSLAPSDQEFVMRFYVDTFGRPEDWRGDTFVC